MSSGPCRYNASGSNDSEEDDCGKDQAAQGRREGRERFAAPENDGHQEESLRIRSYAVLRGKEHNEVKPCESHRRVAAMDYFLAAAKRGNGKCCLHFSFLFAREAQSSQNLQGQ